jgi:hypothetical protein
MAIKLSSPISLDLAMFEGKVGRIWLRGWIDDSTRVVKKIPKP